MEPLARSGSTRLTAPGNAWVLNKIASYESIVQVFIEQPFPSSQSSPAGPEIKLVSAAPTCRGGVNEDPARVAC